MLAILRSLGMFMVDLFKLRCRLEVENLFLAEMPANCGLFVRDQETSVRIISNQTIISGR